MFGLFLILVICAAAYLRAQQSALWNSWVNQAQAPKAWLVDTSVAPSAGDTPALFSVASTTSAPLKPSATVTGGNITVDSAADADFLTQLNAEDADIAQKNNAMLVRDGDAGKAAWDVLDAKIADYESKAISSPLTVNNAQVRQAILSHRKGQVVIASNSPGDFGRYRELVRQLQADRFPEVVALGREKAQPLDLQYTADDGTTVDLAQMRGRVVLIDFWASWCGYCVTDMPAVCAAYAKYHGQGLEIVGVSQDDHKDWLLNFTSQHGMTWPQYFGGDAHGNFITKKYDVGSLPTLWLVDKRGCLVNATRGADLPGQVEKVLAEQ